MTTFDRVKILADKQKISIVELEEKLGFGRNSLYSWKTKIPSGERLRKVADYFNVSTDYLLGRTDSPSPEGEKLSDQEQKLLMRFRRGSQNLSEEEKAIYERQAMNLFDYINKTMHDLDEKNKPE
jgi:transcriptional regulator with XRE-family HTH domain